MLSLIRSTSLNDIFAKNGGELVFTNKELSGIIIMIQRLRFPNKTFVRLDENSSSIS